MTRKTYVLDTSALIFDPTAYHQFSDSDVIIPGIVLNELDDLKKEPGEAGRNARVCIRLLDELIADRDIGGGISLDNNIVLRMDVTYYDPNNPTFAGFGNPNYGDTQILLCAYSHWLAHTAHDVTLVSNDINLRIKAKARGIAAVAHEEKDFSLNELYSGVQKIEDETTGLELQQQGFLDPNEYGLDLLPNECVLFEDENEDGIAMGRKVAPNKLKLIKKAYPWGLSSRNSEQLFAIDLVMDRDIDLVTVVGKAGSGKSLILLAAALELVIGRKEYEKLIIYRPIQSVGNEIGFLPGLIEEKLAPYYQAIMDNFEILFSSKSGGGSDWKKDFEMFQRKGRIELAPMPYIRGRSIHNAIILVDEAQQLTREEVKTILTRAGEGSKIIFNGDIEQIDSPHLDAASNGLVYVIERFKHSDLAGHITFVHGERSRLATLAAEIL
jgi:PhoH-like ATPase